MVPHKWVEFHLCKELHRHLAVRPDMIRHISSSNLNLHIFSPSIHSSRAFISSSSNLNLRNFARILTSRAFITSSSNLNLRSFSPSIYSSRFIFAPMVHISRLLLLQHTMRQYSLVHHVSLNTGSVRPF